MLNHFKCCMVFLHKMTYLTKNVTVQPCISYIHKPASELSVAALQLMFTHFRNERLFYHKKVLNNTMNKLIVLPITFLCLNCYSSYTLLYSFIIPSSSPFISGCAFIISSSWLIIPSLSFSLFSMRSLSICLL